MYSHGMYFRRKQVGFSNSHNCQLAGQVHKHHCVCKLKKLVLVVDLPECVKRFWVCLDYSFLIGKDCFVLFRNLIPMLHCP